MEIKVLGMGCPNYRRVTDLVNQVSKHNIDGTVKKVEDTNEIIYYGVMMTPGLIINGKVKFSGSILKKEEILKWIIEEQ
jgi:small redox-active disulfide protein 2